MVCPPLIIVGCALGSAISEIIYLTIILYSKIIAKTQTVILYLKRPRISFSSALDTAQNDIQCSLKSTIIFPGTNYNTVIAMMPDYLCNILLQGSVDLSLDENKKKLLTAYFSLLMTTKAYKKCANMTSFLTHTHARTHRMQICKYLM